MLASMKRPVIIVMEKRLRFIGFIKTDFIILKNPKNIKILTNNENDNNVATVVLSNSHAQGG
jgi:hypothetical protein